MAVGIAAAVEVASWVAATAAGFLHAPFSCYFALR